MKIIHLRVLVMLVSTVFVGCAGEVGVENMTIRNQEALKHNADTPLANNISLESVFINERMDHWGMTRKKLRGALLASLEKVGLLGKNGKGYYKLKVHLVRSSLTFLTHSVAIQYTLTGKNDDKEIFKKLIPTKYDGIFGDNASFQYEEAIRHNIMTLVDKLYKLKINGVSG